MTITETIKQAQKAAIETNQSVWVAASAGSGKTTVLTNRVLNLLLSETDPSKILCLTFTKAAAAEMENRITNVLKEWTAASGKDLQHKIADLRGFPPDDHTLLKARRLFTDVLETAGGMKIMTIHSFCQSVLKRFPIEAGISPQFDVIDDTQSETLLRQAFNQVILNEELAPDLAYMSDYFQLNNLNTVFKIIKENTTKFQAFFTVYPQIKKVENILKKKFNLSKYTDEKQIFSEFFKSDSEKAGELTKNVFLSMKKTYLSSSALKNKDNKTALLYAETYHKYMLYHLSRLTIHFLKFVKNFMEFYQTLKKEAGVLDYDDLITLTNKLLSERSDWVMYKLDGGIDHILVDEAQDTNAKQWQIIQLISEEFFAGLGRETVMERTLFVVGDKKQSIYSFQGADPLKFDQMKRYFQEKITHSRHTFKIIPMNASFRSTGAVLNLVNDLLKQPSAAKGVVDVNEESAHNLTRIGEAGLIEIHKPVQIYSQRTDERWAIPEHASYLTSVIKLSEQVADKIKSFFDSGEILDSKNRPIEPGDITILVRNRGSIVGEMVRALKERNIPVAGIDKLDLSSHIAVQDLISLAKFALLPEDDLNLACLLKSPLIGISEDELADLCINRKGQSLWESVIKNNKVVTDTLMNVLNLADKMPPYEFFATVLSVYQGRKKILARLGFEAMEAIDEFLNISLSFEQTNTSSLQNFVNWFEKRKSVVKRDMEQNDQNTVKIMTVHASKGLQNNIVFVLDNQNPKSEKPDFIWDQDLPLWAPSAELKNPEEIDKLYQEEKQKQVEEEHRLLYVALTRARDRLYMYGWHRTTSISGEKPKKSKVKKSSEPVVNQGKTWYQLICAALNEIPGEKEVVRITYPNDYQPRFANLNNQKTDSENNLPDWVMTSAPLETPLSKPLMPSRLIENEPQTESVIGTPRGNALKRGTFLHQLLQYLPNISPEKRKETALRLKPDDIDLPDHLFDIFDSEFKELFGKNSMAEVPVVGVVGGRAFSGQIDRLVVTDTEVFIIDYKTNKQVPASPHEVHRIYKMQLAAYKNLIKKIFSDKIIKTFLLWTENMSLMEMTHETASFDELFEKE